MKNMYMIIDSFGRNCVLMTLFQTDGNKTGLFKVVCCGWVNMILPQNQHTGRKDNPLLIYKSLATYPINS